MTNLFTNIVGSAKYNFNGKPVLDKVIENRLNITVTLKSSKGDLQDFSFSDIKFVKSLQGIQANNKIDPRKLIVDRPKLLRMIALAVKDEIKKDIYPSDIDFSSELSIEMEEKVNKAMENLKEQINKLPGFVTVDYLSSLGEPRYNYEICKRVVSYLRQNGKPVTSQMQDAIQRPEIYFDPSYIIEGINMEMTREDIEQNVEIPIAESTGE